MTVQAAIADLQTKWLATSGDLGAVKAAPQHPTESANQFPFAVTYEESGALLTYTSTFGDQLVTLVSELHLARQSLPKAVSAAMSYRDVFLRKLLNDPQLSNSISTIVGADDGVAWRFGQLQWGSLKTIGYQFRIRVKVALSVS